MSPCNAVSPQRTLTIRRAPARGTCRPRSPRGRCPRRCPAASPRRSLSPHGSRPAAAGRPHARHDRVHAADPPDVQLHHGVRRDDAHAGGAPCRGGRGHCSACAGWLRRRCCDVGPHDIAGSRPGAAGAVPRAGAAAGDGPRAPHALPGAHAAAARGAAARQRNPTAAACWDRRDTAATAVSVSHSGGR